MRPPPISPSVDYDMDGVQHGFLKLPHSRNDSAWGAVMIPIAVIKRGDGPTALLTGANHGDEYEGPIALMKLANALGAQDVTGRVIVVPAMNYPAFCSGHRTSPLEQHPGRALGAGHVDDREILDLEDQVPAQVRLQPIGGHAVDMPLSALHRQHTAPFRLGGRLDQRRRVSQPLLDGQPDVEHGHHRKCLRNLIGRKGPY